MKTGQSGLRPRTWCCRADGALRRRGLCGRERRHRQGRPGYHPRRMGGTERESRAQPRLLDRMRRFCGIMCGTTSRSKPASAIGAQRQPRSPPSASRAARDGRLHMEPRSAAACHDAVTGGAAPRSTGVGVVVVARPACRNARGRSGNGARHHAAGRRGRFRNALYRTSSCWRSRRMAGRSSMSPNAPKPSCPTTRPRPRDRSGTGCRCRRKFPGRFDKHGQCRRPHRFLCAAGARARN